MNNPIDEIRQALNMAKLELETVSSIITDMAAQGADMPENIYVRDAVINKVESAITALDKLNEQYEEIYIGEIDGLDPVTVLLKDFSTCNESKSGKVIIECYGKAWSAYFGSMGNMTIKQFISSCDADYLGRKMFYGDTEEIDYDAISKKIGSEIDVTTAMMQSDLLAQHYGDDWYMDLPTKAKSDWLYLKRILNAVIENFRNALQSHDKEG